METLLIIYLLFIHWVSDFLLQNDWMATNKSKKISALLAHTFIYSTFFVIMFWLGGLMGIIPIVSLSVLFELLLILFASHSLIDYLSSKTTTRLYANKRYRAFFDVIGFDQLMHYATIFMFMEFYELYIF